MIVITKIHTINIKLKEVNNNQIRKSIKVKVLPVIKIKNNKSKIKVKIIQYIIVFMIHILKPD